MFSLLQIRKRVLFIALLALLTLDQPSFALEPLSSCIQGTRYFEPGEVLKGLNFTYHLNGFQMPTGGRTYDVYSLSGLMAQTPLATFNNFGSKTIDPHASQKFVLKVEKPRLDRGPVRPEDRARVINFLENPETLRLIRKSNPYPKTAYWDSRNGKHDFFLHQLSEGRLNLQFNHLLGWSWTDYVKAGEETVTVFAQKKAPGFPINIDSAFLGKIGLTESTLIKNALGKPPQEVMAFIKYHAMLSSYHEIFEAIEELEAFNLIIEPMINSFGFRSGLLDLNHLIWVDSPEQLQEFGLSEPGFLILDILSTEFLR